MGNSKRRYAVDYRIDEDRTNEEFIPRSDANIMAILKQTFAVDYRIHRQSTNE